MLETGRTANAVSDKALTLRGRVARRHLSVAHQAWDFFQRPLPLLKEARAPVRCRSQKGLHDRQIVRGARAIGTIPTVILGMDDA